MNELEILYISDSCSKEKYEWAFGKMTEKHIQPQQKFNRLIIDGLSLNDNVNVSALSCIPLSSSNSHIDQIVYEEERVSNNLIYYYIPFRNTKIYRYLDCLLYSKKIVKKWIKRTNGKRRVVVADALNPFTTYFCLKYANKKKISSFAIVTDLPQYTTEMKKRGGSRIRNILTKIIEKNESALLKKYTAYITLTESINDSINVSNKPHIVIEGCADYTQKYYARCNCDRKVVLYAGGIYEKYGVGKLAEAFSTLKGVNAELVFYGDGTYINEIQKIAGRSMLPIKYKGVVTPQEIVGLERESALLVNPRPTDEPFAKYSFPSKTLEYMSSGTPLLTTKLPGIPNEYFSYCYTIKDETIAGIKKSLEKILNLSYDELNKKGKAAFDFVYANKDNITQARKIIDFFIRIDNELRPKDI